MAKISVNQTQITIVKIEDQDYISLTDIVKAKETASSAVDAIKNWLLYFRVFRNVGTDLQP